jgi:hypothetical protein
VDRGHGMLRDWGVCWLLAVFSVRDLSRQSMTVIGSNGRRRSAANHSLLRA